MKKLTRPFVATYRWAKHASGPMRLFVAAFLMLIMATVFSVLGQPNTVDHTLVSDHSVTYTGAQEDSFMDSVEEATFVESHDGYVVFFTLESGTVVHTTVPEFDYKEYFTKLESHDVGLNVGQGAGAAKAEMAQTETAPTVEGVAPGPGPSYSSSTAGNGLEVSNREVRERSGSTLLFFNLSKAGYTLGILMMIGSAMWGLARGHRRALEEQERARNPEAAAAAAGGGKGKESAHFVGEVPDVRFSDVAGAEEAVDELREMVEYLKDPSRFTALGAKPPRGAIMSGSPGTGKTLLARAVAGEAGVPFFSASGSDFVEVYVGVGPKRIRELFSAAKSHPAAIVFIDEIDAFARQRSAGPGSHQESENTLIALMTELDGFADRGNLIVLAATNRPDLLDSAVTRPGRLDRKVEVGLPDRRGREKILAVHARNRPISEEVSFEHVAKRTPGFSGAQLEAIVNEACMVAARRHLTEVTVEAFDDAIATVAMGRARESALVMPSDRIITAWHEAGHTLAAFLLPDADDPVQVTIVPRGPAGGVTWMSSTDEIFMTRAKAHAQLVVAMAGRAGEEYYLNGEFTSGASGDLQSANQLATAMVAQYAMSRLGYVLHDPKSPAVIEVVNELLDEAHERATDLIQNNRVLMEALVAKLLEEENVSHAQLMVLFSQHGVDVADHVVRAPALPPKSRRVLTPVSEVEEIVEPAIAAAAHVYKPVSEVESVPTLRQYVVLRLKRKVKSRSSKALG